MGWQSEDGLHEGYVVPEFADGVRGRAISTSAVPDTEVIIDVVYGETPLGDRYVTRLAGEVVGWRVLCDCRSSPGGAPLPPERRWSSELIRRVPSPVQAVPGQAIFAADEDVVDVHWAFGDELSAVWSRGHADGQRAVAAVREATERLQEATTALDGAVRRARAQGASWEAIGRAAGITRQSAHARWGQPDRD